MLVSHCLTAVKLCSAVMSYVTITPSTLRKNCLVTLRYLRHKGDSLLVGGGFKTFKLHPDSTETSVSSPLLSSCIPQLQRHLAAVHIYCLYAVIDTFTCTRKKRPFIVYASINTQQMQHAQYKCNVSTVHINLLILNQLQKAEAHFNNVSVIKQVFKLLWQLLLNYIPLKKNISMNFSDWPWFRTVLQSLLDSWTVPTFYKVSFSFSILLSWSGFKRLSLTEHTLLQEVRRSEQALSHTHTPTVAETPGGKESSQNRRRKDVFPTPEFPTRITLKRRSGRKGALLS